MKDIILKPIDLRVGDYQLTSLNGKDLENYHTAAEDVFKILSDDETLQFIPEKRLRSVKDAQEWLFTNVLNFHTGRNYLQVIRSGKTGRLIGMIDLLSPALVREHYQLEEYPYFLEFYLKSEVRGASIMTVLLPELLRVLHARGISKIAAVADRSNLAARSVLARSGFVDQGVFDLRKDLFEATDQARAKYAV